MTNKSNITIPRPVWANGPAVSVEEIRKGMDHLLDELGTSAHNGETSRPIFHVLECVIEGIELDAEAAEGKPFQFQFLDNNGEDIYLLATFDDFFEGLRKAREFGITEWYFDGDCASTNTAQNMTDRAGNVLTGSYALIIR